MVNHNLVEEARRRFPAGTTCRNNHAKGAFIVTEQYEESVFGGGIAVISIDDGRYTLFDGKEWATVVEPAKLRAEEPIQLNYYLW